MELVKSVDDWDLEAAKSLTWARRFEGKCPGRTANFGLELISKKPDDGVKLSKRKRAVWSFFNDRFVPVQGRFHGPHAFSETAAEPCTGEFDITKTMVGQ
jgi:hypothetical protein